MNAIVLEREACARNEAPLPVGREELERGENAFAGRAR